MLFPIAPSVIARTFYTHALPFFFLDLQHGTQLCPEVSNQSQHAIFCLHDPKAVLIVIVFDLIRTVPIFCLTRYHRDMERRSKTYRSTNTSRSTSRNSVIDNDNSKRARRTASKTISTTFQLSTCEHSKVQFHAHPFQHFLLLLPMCRPSINCLH